MHKFAIFLISFLFICGLCFGKEVMIDLSKKLSLDACISIAKRHNPDILEAKQNVRIGNVNLRSSLSEFMPQIGFGGRYNRVAYPGQTWVSPEGRITNQRETYSAGFSLYQKIFDLNNLVSIMKSNAYKRVYKQEYWAVESDVILEIVRSYYTLVKQKKLLDAKLKKLEESKQRVDRVAAMLELGTISRVELLQAKVSLSQSKLDVIQAEKELQLAKSNLLVKMGLEPTMQIDIEDNLSEAVDSVPALGSLLNKAYENRPEIKRCKAMIAACRAELNSALGNYLPEIYLSASYSYFGEQFPCERTLWSKEGSWNISIIVRLPILTGLSRSSQIDAASANVSVAEQELRKTKLNIALEVKNAWLSLKEAIERLSLTKVALNEAEQSYTMVKEKFALGAVSMIDLLNAEAMLSSSQASRIEALANYEVAKVSLKIVAGVH